jgi:hypothetical protein
MGIRLLLGPENESPLHQNKKVVGILGAENSAPKLGCGKSKRLFRWQHRKKNGRGSREKDSRATQRTKGKIDCTHEIQK